MGVWAWGLGVAIGLFALDRLLLWMEAKGWIYWRRVKRKGAASDFLLGLESIGGGAAAHAVEARKTVLEEKDDGDDDDDRKPEDQVL